jgi:hypothetical protein
MREPTPWDDSLELNHDARLLSGALVQCLGCHKGFPVRATVHESHVGDGMIRESMPMSFKCPHCGGISGDEDAPRQVSDCDHWPEDTDPEVILAQTRAKRHAPTHAVAGGSGDSTGEVDPGDPLLPIFVWDCPECAVENWDWMWIVAITDDHGVSKAPWFVCCRSCHHLFRAVPAFADGAGEG